MAQKKLTTWQAACLITGYSVGSGIMALPYLMSKAGIVPGIIIIIAAFVLSYCLHILLAELAMGAEGSSQIISIFAHYLKRSKASKVAGGVCAVLLVVALFFAQAGFISGGAEVLATTGMPLLAAQLLFYAIAVIVVYFGLKVIGVSESISVSIIIAIIAVLAVASLPHLGNGSGYPAVGEPSDILGFYGMTMFAFVAFFSVPQVVEGLDHDAVKVRKAILIGMGVNVALIAVITSCALAASYQVSDVAMIGWSQGIGAWAQVIGGAFTVLAMLTTYWSNCLACMDMLREQFKLGHLASWLVATIPSILLVLLVSGDFIGNMSLAAGLVAIIIAISLPFVFKRAMSERMKLDLMPKWMASTPMLIVLVIAFVFMAIGSLS